MNDRAKKILVIAVVVSLLLVAGFFIARAFSPESRIAECKEAYVAEYGGADCEAALDIEE